MGRKQVIWKYGWQQDGVSLHESIKTESLQTLKVWSLNVWKLHSLKLWRFEGLKAWICQNKIKFLFLFCLTNLSDCLTFKLQPFNISSFKTWRLTILMLSPSQPSDSQSHVLTCPKPSCYISTMPHSGFRRKHVGRIWNQTLNHVWAHLESDVGHICRHRPPSHQ